MNDPPFLAVAALLLGAVLLAYAPALDAGFIWDDDYYVTENDTLVDAEGLRRIWFERGAVPQYYPVVHTTFWLEHKLWGLDPTGFHWVNVLLHALNAILLWRLLKRLELPVPWLVAAFFALHPVEVESVAWVTERKNVLSGAFYFASLLLYWRFAEGARAQRGRPRDWAVALVFYVAALLSKSVTCTLPAVIAVLLWWRRGRLHGNDLKPLLPFLVIGLALGINTVFLEATLVGAVGGDWDFSIVERFLIAGRVLWFYAGKLLWPHPLAFMYERWDIDAGVWWQYLFPLAAMGVMAALWFLRERIGRGPLAAVLIFAGTLFPALGFISVFPMRYSFVADHFQYLASASLIVLAVCGLAVRLVPLGAVVNRAAFALAACILVVYGVLVWQQAHVYEDREHLWADTVTKSPGSGMAQISYAYIMRGQGREEESLFHFGKAAEAAPYSAHFRFDYGLALERAGRDDDAAAQFRAVRELVPNGPEYDGIRLKATMSLGVVHQRKGDQEGAFRLFKDALEQDPDSLKQPELSARAHTYYGGSLWFQGRREEATPHLDYAMKLAWNMATGEGVPAARVGESLVIARMVSHVTAGENLTYQDVLAATWAQNGNLEMAIQVLSDAIERARQQGQQEHLASLEGRLARYRRHQDAASQRP